MEIKSLLTIDDLILRGFFVELANFNTGDWRGVKTSVLLSKNHKRFLTWSMDEGFSGRFVEPMEV